MPTVAELIAAIERFAPPEFAEPWDKVGLHVGSAQRSLDGPVLLTIDLTEPVLAEAIDHRASAIIAYHPPIFEPLNRVTDGTPRQRIVLRAIEHRIAIYSPHTALDAAEGGVTDWLCEGLSGGGPGEVRGDCRALTAHEGPGSCKIVTFVPEPHAEAVRNALASSGAGIIGDYRVCSFSARGRGTFLGLEGTRPAVGEAGRIEEVDEVRLEMICPQRALALAVETLRRFHPYEEPAIDIYPLRGLPRRGVGPGRRLVLDRPATVAQLGQRLVAHLGRARVQTALAAEPDTPIDTVGVVPGAGASLARLARDQGCQVFVTGEMRHHEIIASRHAGLSIVLAGHTNTERGFLPRLADRLRADLPGVGFEVSKADADPLKTMN